VCWVAPTISAAGYAHLPLAIIDSVYSLRSRYKVAQNAVSAYCEHVGINDRGDADSIDVDERSIDDSSKTRAV
jgi:hypothetical protein